MSRATRRASAYRGPAYGGQSFREPPIYRRNRSGGRPAERPEVVERWVPADEPVWAVRVEIRSLAEPEAPAPVRPAAPAELVQALEGARELRAVGSGSTWRLIRDGEFVGTVSRPTDVHLAEVLPPEPSFVSAVDPVIAALSADR